jgi:ferric-dicitrate binding protein FerR (iron transport regulator)
VAVTGGAGAVTTYRADGSYSADFAHAQPYTATTPDGHRLSVAATGAASGTFTASAGQFSLVSDQTTLTVTISVDGAVTSTQQASRTSSAQYVCTAGSHLTLSSGNSATQYVPAG